MAELALQRLSVLAAKSSIYLAGCGGPIEGVEVNAPNMIVKKIPALLGGPVNADATDIGLVAGAAANGALEPRRIARAQRHFSHSRHAFARCNWHNACED